MALTIHLSPSRQILEVELPLGKRSEIPLNEGGLHRLLNLLLLQERMEFIGQGKESNRLRQVQERHDLTVKMFGEAGSLPPTRLPPRGWGSRAIQPKPEADFDLSEIGL